MIGSTFRSAAFGLGALLLASASIVSAQYAERPADRLSRHLRELASDPQNVTALIGAAQASLDVGDGNAALGFFARADEKAPRNGQVKAGLARALLMVDNPREALKMFDAARSLGVADAQLAPDRGLAYDLKGDNKRAQQDYALVLAQGPNDEVSKRFALSLGITGDRDRALKLLDPLLYKRDQGAWRARAFVLAMTGDAPGASRIVHQVMPARMAQTMDGFLPRLAALNPAQKAAAVHLGELPSDVRFASNTVQQPAYAAPAPTPVPTPTPATTPMREPESRDVRRRPGTTAILASPPPPKVRRRGSAQPLPVPTPTPAPDPPAPQQLAETDMVQPTYAQVAAAPLQPSFTPPPRPAYKIPPRPTPTPRATSAATASLPVEQRGDLEAIIRSIRESAAAPRPAPTPTRLAQAETPKPKPTPSTAASLKAKGGPVKEEAGKAEPKAKGGKAAVAEKVDPKAKTAKASAADKKKKPEPPKNPARIWVQVAGGANAKDLPKEWSSVSGKHSELKGKGPYTARNRATNRLLAGPFKSEDEAQAAVAKLRKAGIGAFQWKSDEGEAVQKIGGK